MRNFFFRRIFLLFLIIFVIFAGGFFYFHPEQKTIEEKGLVKGKITEKIGDVDHQVEIFYARPGLSTKEEIFKDLGIKIFAEDQVFVFPDPVLGLGSKIVVKRATPIIVDDGGVENVYYTWKTTVKDFLSEKGITLDEDDFISHDLEAKLQSNLKIKITRVSISEIKEKETISYKTIIREDPELEKGKTRLVQKGVKGIREKTYKIRKENGQEVSRKLIRDEVLQPAQNKIIYKGTKTIVYGTGIATWYNWISGMRAAHNSLPYGTKVLVTNLANGKQTTVTIVDHGIQGEAIIDLSADAFSQIASLSQGKIRVRLEKP